MIWEKYSNPYVSERRSKMHLYLPDSSLGEPRLIPDGRHGCVHKWVGLDELQGIIRKLNGALKGCSWTVTCTAPGARIERAHTEDNGSEINLHDCTPGSHNNLL